MPSSLAEEWQYRVDLVDRSLAVRREEIPATDRSIAVSIIARSIPN